MTERLQDHEQETIGQATRAGFVALLGWTNVGKSTLLNRLVGCKLAAVADAPQTTRTRITGALTLPDRGQLVFVDTPGFHKPRHRMNRAMIERARRTLDSVDVVLQIIDAARGAGPGDAEIARSLAGIATPRLAALNKIDAVHPKSRLLPLMRTVVEEWGFPEALPISALTGEGCPALRDRLLSLLPEGPPLFAEDYLTDQPERQLVAEWIREKLIRHTRQELPHAIAVRVERWEERGDGLVHIAAEILVERESQKAIVIGREGSLLKRVGSEAREESERFLGVRVFLELRVRVRRDWRDDPRVLRELGLA